MIEYRGKVFVGLENKTWYEIDCSYLAASDEGDARAIEAMEHQVINSIPASQIDQIAFVLFSPTTLEIIEDEEDAESNGSNWLAYGKWLDEEELDDYEDYDDADEI